MFHTKALLNPIKVEIRRTIGVITLNNPTRLNVLTHEVIKQLTRQIEQFNTAESISAIVLCAASPDKIEVSNSVFSAGGDLKCLYDFACRSNSESEKDAHEYLIILNNLISLISLNYKPIITINDGLTLGAGLGISRQAKFRIATEKTFAAMPENAIGYFTNVGASYFLPRVAANNLALGIYLGLSGKRINASDCLTLGFHTHYISGQYVVHLIDELSNCNNSDDIQKILDRISKDYSSESTTTDLDIKKINYFFNSTRSVNEIVHALASHKDDAWCIETLSVLMKMCPLSLLITHYLISQGAKSSLQECLMNELNAGYLVFNKNGGILTPDFLMGSGKIVNKSRSYTSWHSTLEHYKQTNMEVTFSTLRWPTLPVARCRM